MAHVSSGGQPGSQAGVFGYWRVGSWNTPQFTNANWWHTTIRDLPDQTEHEFTLPLPLLYFIKTQRSAGHKHKNEQFEINCSK